MNERVYVMRESVVKLTQMLAGKGIQVTQRGVSAFVKADSAGRPFLVNLPYLPDNATDELIDAIQGFLDHEVAHILFTEFNVMDAAIKSGSGQMLNLIEDSRIERCMAQRFQGSGLNLANTGKFFLDKYTTPRVAEAVAKGDTDTVIGALMVPLIRAMAGQQVFKEYMKDKMHIIAPVYDQIKDLADRIEGATSTRDCLEIAEEVTKRLKAAKPAPPAPPAPTPPSPSGDAGEGGGKGEKSKEKPAKSPKPKKAKAEPKPKDDEEEEEGEPTPGEKDPAATEPPEEDPEADPTPAPTDEEDPEADPAADPEEDEADPEADPEADEEEGEEEEEGEGEEGDDEPMPDEEDGDLSGGGGDDEGDEEGDGMPEASDGASKPAESETDITKAAGINWSAIDKETKRDFDETMSTLISSAACDAAKESDYLIYTKDKDVVEPLKVGREYDSAMLTRLQSKVDHMVAPLQKDLERAIAARSLSMYSAGHRSGRIHAANLSRLAVGDDRVFRRKHEATSKDVAVELVVDASGSMDGQKIDTATQAAYALASVLERIGIKCEVICFTTGEGCADHATLSAETAKLGRRFSRVEALYMPILKGFDERMTTDVKARFGWLPNSNILHNNVDGECVEIAARRLMNRRETGKIMMVLSDGAPHAAGETHTLAPHLKKTIADITRAGVNVIGIGIQSDEVRRFYPKHLTLNNVEDLPGVVMKELRALILK